MTDKIVSLSTAFVLTLFAIALLLKVLPAAIPLTPADPIVLQNQLRILKTARESILTSTDWTKEDDRICLREDMSISLFCALAFASVDTIGYYDHDGPAVLAVRNRIVSNYSSRWVGHPIMDFNNHDDTTREEILDLLAAAEADFSRQLAASNR